jgi:hypothetical protein
MSAPIPKPESCYPGLEPRTITKMYVVANDTGEGHSLPYLAFSDLGRAIQWVESSGGAWSIAEVPIYPELPAKPWYQMEEIRWEK